MALVVGRRARQVLDLPDHVVAEVADPVSYTHLVAEMDFQMIWCPVLMADPDGTRWGLFMHLVDASGFGHHQRTVTGSIEHLDGNVERMADIRPDLTYDPSNRRLRGGTVSVTLADGSPRTFTLEVPTDTGFHLGAGLYFGWQGHHHGEWRGELVVDGERLEDCRLPEVAHQRFRRPGRTIEDNPTQSLSLIHI